MRHLLMYYRIEALKRDNKKLKQLSSKKKSQILIVPIYHYDIDAILSGT